MNKLNPFGTGRIGEIIAFLKAKYQVDNVRSLSLDIKLGALCEVLQLSPPEFDLLITSNPPVIRTIVGHSFETLFDYIIEHNGHTSIEVGGDGDIDRVVNGVSLQLKTPYSTGTRGIIAQYKTHKTHGSKSEAESEGYYHYVHDFAEYLVGLLSYKPFQVVFVHKSELPTHKLFPDRILSPFKIDLSLSAGINNFSLIGIDNIKLDTSLFAFTDSFLELLPLSAQRVGLITEIIIDTILNESNFRVWDMNMRGFSREFFFRKLMNANGLQVYEPSAIRQHRADKADLAMMNKNGEIKFMQMKGLSVSLCRFNGHASIIYIETQLTRGRRNDHETQSRLYRIDDFDCLIIGVDPSITQKLQYEMGNIIPLTWEFYAIPASALAKYYLYPNRYAPVQKFYYNDIQDFLVNESWLVNWQ